MGYLVKQGEGEVGTFIKAEELIQAKDNTKIRKSGSNRDSRGVEHLCNSSVSLGIVCVGNYVIDHDVSFVTDVFYRAVIILKIINSEPHECRTLSNKVRDSISQYEQAALWKVS